MTDRVLHYYQTITDPGFANHMITEIGLNENQQKMVLAFRKNSGSTQFYADRFQVPIKRFNEITAGIHKRMMDELLRLALIGWRAEQNKN